MLFSVWHVVSISNLNCPAYDMPWLIKVASLQASKPKKKKRKKNTLVKSHYTHCPRNRQRTVAMSKKVQLVNPVTYYESFMPTIIAVQIGVRAHRQRPTRDKTGDEITCLRHKKIMKGSSIGGYCIADTGGERGCQRCERKQCRGKKQHRPSRHPSWWQRRRRSTATNATTYASSAQGFVCSGSHTTALAVQNLPDSRVVLDWACLARRDAPAPRPEVWLGHVGRTAPAMATRSSRP